MKTTVTSDCQPIDAHIDDHKAYTLRSQINISISWDF